MRHGDISRGHLHEPSPLTPTKLPLGATPSRSISRTDLSRTVSASVDDDGGYPSARAVRRRSRSSRSVHAAPDPDAVGHRLHARYRGGDLLDQRTRRPARPCRGPHGRRETAASSSAAHRAAACRACRRRARADSSDRSPRHPRHPGRCARSRHPRALPATRSRRISRSPLRPRPRRSPRRHR